MTFLNTFCKNFSSFLIPADGLRRWFPTTFSIFFAFSIYSENQARRWWETTFSQSKQKIALIFIFITFLSPALFAQYTLSGTITQTNNSKPIPNAEIFVLNTSQIYKTNGRGYYVINNLTSGDYNLVIFLSGYETLQETITIEEQNIERNFSLKKLQIELSEIVVREEQEKLFALKRLKPVEGTAIYAGKKTEVILIGQLIANTAANNARQIYGQIAGLNIYEAGDAGLQLNIGGRGLDPNRTASFNTRQNGYDISADVLGYPESYYSPPAEALEEIQVIRGAASLQYGTQFGGLVNFIFKKPHPVKKIALISRQTIGSNQLFTSFNSLSGTLNKFSYYTYFNYKKGDDFRPNSAFESKNFFAHLNYDFTENTALNVELTYLDYLAQQPGGLTDAQFYEDAAFSNRSRNWFKVDWLLYAAQLKHKFSPKADLSLQLFGLQASRKAVGFRTNRVSQTDVLESPRDLLIGNFNNWGAELRFLRRYQIGKKQTSPSSDSQTSNSKSAVFLIGAKYYQSNNSAIQNAGTGGSDADFSIASEQFSFYPNQSDFRFPNLNLALFGENIFYFTEKLSLTPGFRYEFINTQSIGTFRKIDTDLAGNPIRDQTFPDDRTFKRNLFLLGLGASYKANQSLEAYANFSQNYRSVTFNDIHVVNPAFQIDPDISDEKGFTADLGFRGRNKRLSYELGGFGLLYDDRLGEVLQAEVRVNADGVEQETGRIVRFRGNIGTAFTYGLEGLADWNVLGTRVDSSQQYKLNYFVNLALTRSQYLKSEIAGIEGNQVEFIPLVNLKTGLRFGYQNLLGNLQFTYLSEQFTDASNALQDRQDNQSGIKGVIPAYSILDLSLSYRWRFLKIETGVNNLLDAVYFTRRATGYPGPGIIPSQPRTWYVTLQLDL